MTSYSASVRLNNTITSTSTSEAATANAVRLAAQNAYPVGAVFMAVVNTNPNTLLGFGTWTQIAQGRAIIGVGTGNDGNNTLTTTAAEQTGGFYRHTLSTSEIPSHAHNVFIPGRGVSSPSNNNTVGLGNNAILGQVDINTSFVGGSSSHNNTQPYFSLYIWKRTA